MPERVALPPSATHETIFPALRPGNFLAARLLTKPGLLSSRLHLPSSALTTSPQLSSFQPQKQTFSPKGNGIPGPSRVFATPPGLLSGRRWSYLAFVTRGIVQSGYSSWQILTLLASQDIFTERDVNS